MKTDFLTAVRMVKEDKNLSAEEDLNGLEAIHVDGEFKVYAAECNGGAEVYSVPMESILTEWTVYAPLGYKLDRTGEDRCYTLPGAKSILNTLVSPEEEKVIKEDLARIEKNKNIHPFGYDGKVVFVFDTGERLRSDLNMSLKRRIELGEDKTVTFQKVQAIWITPAEPEGIKPELIYTDKDGFI